MNDPVKPSERRPPSLAYALILGVLVVGAVLAVIYGKHAQNPNPTPVASGVVTSGP